MREPSEHCISMPRPQISLQYDTRDATEFCIVVLSARLALHRFCLCHASCRRLRSCRLRGFRPGDSWHFQEEQGALNLSSPQTRRTYERASEQQHGDKRANNNQLSNKNIHQVVLKLAVVRSCARAPNTFHWGARQREHNNPIVSTSCAC